jgi:hypothetical protein
MSVDDATPFWTTHIPRICIPDDGTRAVFYLQNHRTGRKKAPAQQDLSYQRMRTLTALQRGKGSDAPALAHYLSRLPFILPRNPRGNAIERRPTDRLLRRLKCSHSVIVSSDLWPDHVRLSDLEPKFTCRECGRRGADVRPLFEKAAMGTEGGDPK